MAGKTEFEAYRNFRDSLQRALSCVTEGRLAVPAANRFEKDVVYAVALHRGEPVQLRGSTRLQLSVLHNFRIVDATGDRGPFKVQTVKYFYQISSNRQDEILAFHWEPETRTGRTFPHLHIGQISIDVGAPIADDRFHRLHVPTGRVALEAILRFLIEDLQAEPIRDDWQDVLDSEEAAFNRYKTR